MARPTALALPFSNRNLPSLHRGIVNIPAAAAGVFLVDLGLKHNNFVVTSLIVIGGATEGANGYKEYWNYHATRKGVFVITVMKRPAAYGAWIAATAALQVSFAVQDNPISVAIPSV